MSDEPTKPAKWQTLPVTLFAIVALVAYQGTHYATSTFVCKATCGYYTHQIGGKEFPPWANGLFWPAERFDELIDISAWKSP